MSDPTISILLVEDHPDDAFLLGEMLAASHLRHAIRQAVRLDQAVAMVAENRCDIVLLDLGLPDGSGLDTFIRFQQRAPHLPVVVLSGLSDEEVALKAVKSGAQEYLVKGRVDGPTLARAIHYSIERKKIEMDLIESEQRFRCLADATLEGLVIHEEGRILEVNTAMAGLMGCPAAELIGGQLADLVEPAARPILESRTDPASDGPCEARFVRKDGGAFLAEIHSNALPWQGRPCRVEAIRDITRRRQDEEERLRLENQLQESLRMKSLGLLAGGVAHDFNDLLQGILGNAELARLNLNRADMALRNLDKIQRSARRAAALTKQMLAYSGRGRYVKTRTDLNRLLQRMTLQIGRLAKDANHIQWNLAENLPDIAVDPSQVKQAIDALLRNAAESYGGQGGAIRITTGTMRCGPDFLSLSWLDEQLPEGLYSFVEVADEGCGMDDASKEKIFDPFFTTKIMGRGLGLAMALGIMRSHKGIIRFESAYGKGSTFRLYFPSIDLLPDMVS